MRTSDHYVQVTVTAEEKARFLQMVKACRHTEKTALIKMLQGDTLREYPPEGIDSLFRRGCRP